MARFDVIDTLVDYREFLQHQVSQMEIETNNQLSIVDPELSAMIAELKHQMGIQNSRRGSTEVLLQHEIMGTQSIVPALAELKDELALLMEIETNIELLQSRLTDLNHELYLMALQDDLAVEEAPARPIHNTFLFLGCCPMFTLQAWRSTIWTWIRSLLWWKRSPATTS